MRALLLAAVVLAAPLAAQPEAADPVDHLTEVLALSPDQADLVAEILVPRDPAALWTLTAELVPTLSAEQEAALFARPERPQGPQGVGRTRGQRADGAGRRGDRERAPAQVAVMRAARDVALGLDADQSAALDAAIEGLDRRALRQALRDGTLPDAIAAVLAPEQQALYRAHTALQFHVMRARMAARRGM